MVSEIQNVRTKAPHHLSAKRLDVGFKEEISDVEANPEEFPDFMTSLGPWPFSDVLKFLEDEYSTRYKATDAMRIQRFLETKYQTLALFN